MAPSHRLQLGKPSMPAPQVVSQRTLPPAAHRVPSGSLGPRSPSCSRTRSMSCTVASTRLLAIFASVRFSGRLLRWTTSRAETSGLKTPGLFRSSSTWSRPRTLMRRWSQVRASPPAQQDRPPLHPGLCSGWGSQSGRRRVTASQEHYPDIPGHRGVRTRKWRERAASRHCP